MKIATLLLFLLSATIASAQLGLNKASSVASAMGFDPAKTGKGIMDSLTPKLGLSNDQVTSVSGIVNQFLTNKSSYIATAKTKPAEYKTKFDAEQKTMLDKVKGAISPDQFTKFLGLKPAQTDTANALTQLFY